jgi:predicted amidohydrolase YtcJ
MTCGANQRITVDEAIRVNSLNGAYASHEDSIKGSIAANKLADFVLLRATRTRFRPTGSRISRSSRRSSADRQPTRHDASPETGVI